MALGALGVNPDTKFAVMQCTTFHLSAFAGREDSTTPQWNTADLFIDFRILAKVGYAQNVNKGQRVHRSFFAQGMCSAAYSAPN